MEWSFDIRSGLLVAALLTAAVGVVMWLVSRGFPPAYRGAMTWWVAGNLLLPAAFVAVAALARTAPWAAVLVSNTLVVAGLAAYAIALEVFHGAPRRRIRLCLLGAGAVLVSVGLAQLLPDATVRLALVVALLTAMLGCGLFNLYGVPASQGRPRHIVGVVIVTAAGILLWRAVTMMLEPVPVLDPAAPGIVPVLLYAVGSALPVLASVGFLLMCTERSQRELAHAARVDFLTGCYNRRAIEELGARAIAASRRHGMPLSLLAIDIDHFKRINDELGHAAGDDALTLAVERIRDTLRSEDLLGRIGGEEFVVLMPATDGAAAVVAGERIRQAFSSQPLAIDGQARRVTLSVGVAVLAPGDRGFGPLLQRADRAMYAAKHAGRDLVMSDPMSGWDDAAAGA